jgi:glycosyltransferase involved in cell wall biosynthesis
MKFVIGYVAFIVMSFFYALKHLRRGDILLCIDLETALLGMLAAKIRGAKIHYDMADPFFLVKPLPFKQFWRKLEAWFLQRADLATVPHSSRLDLFFAESPSNVRIVENVPDITTVGRRPPLRALRGGRSLLTLGYFGTLDRHRGIEDILALVEKHSDVQLKIGGRGILQPLVVEASYRCNRVQFFGVYLPDELKVLTQGVDVYCSLYLMSKPLHRFAAPNKYYEHLALGLPILISAGTPYSSDVQHNGTGWVVDDGRDALEHWYTLVRDDVDTFELFAKRAHMLWETRYVGWLESQQNFFANFG